MGELAGADVFVDPADLEGAEPRGHERASGTSPSCASSRRASREGKARRVVFRFFESPVAILGDERVEGIELVRNVLDENERAGRHRASARRSRAASSSAASVTRRRAARRAVRRAQRHDRERGRAGRRDGQRRRLLRRLDQARPDRRDRHEQEGRDRDGRAAPRGRCLGPAPAEARGDRRGRRRAARRARRARRRVRGLDGDRRGRARGRREERAPAGEALLLGRASRRRRARASTPSFEGTAEPGSRPMDPRWNRSSWNVSAAAPRV